ncbi:hypothetical protein PG994_000316 [Apiospora phragmitis]|uniref:Uncharacterized protein n=1 Tax=Apiospora phragmitis TaxID=2905665 RepID=A0ABR1X5Z8_9PEZI
MNPYGLRVSRLVIAASGLDGFRKWLALPANSLNLRLGFFCGTGGVESVLLMLAYVPMISDSTDIPVNRPFTGRLWLTGGSGTSKAPLTSLTPGASGTTLSSGILAVVRYHTVPVDLQVSFSTHISNRKSGGWQLTFLFDGNAVKSQDDSTDQGTGCRGPRCQTHGGAKLVIEIGKPSNEVEDQPGHHDTGIYAHDPP